MPARFTLSGRRPRCAVTFGMTWSSRVTSPGRSAIPTGYPRSAPHRISGDSRTASRACRSPAGRRLRLSVHRRWPGDHFHLRLLREVYARTAPPNEGPVPVTKRLGMPHEVHHRIDDHLRSPVAGFGRRSLSLTSRRGYPAHSDVPYRGTPSRARCARPCPTRFLPCRPSCNSSRN